MLKINPQVIKILEAKRYESAVSRRNWLEAFNGFVVACNDFKLNFTEQHQAKLEQFINKINDHNIVSWDNAFIDELGILYKNKSVNALIVKPGTTNELLKLEINESLKMTEVKKILLNHHYLEEISEKTLVEDTFINKDLAELCEYLVMIAVAIQVSGLEISTLQFTEINLHIAYNYLIEAEKKNTDWVFWPELFIYPIFARLVFGKIFVKLAKAGQNSDIDGLIEYANNKAASLIKSIATK